MSRELMPSDFETVNAAATDWYIFRTDAGMTPHRWCMYNCEDEWFSVRHTDSVLFFLKNAEDAIPFRIRQKSVKYLGHSRCHFQNSQPILP